MNAARPIPPNVLPMQPKPAQPFVLTWRRALLTSDLPSVTRHLLLTLSVYMDADGLCWPNVDELIGATGLSKPTVTKHAQLAEEAGWITTAHVGTGQGWRSKSYHARLPENVVNLVADVVKEVDHLSGERGKADTSNVVKEVNTNSPVNSPRDEGGGARAREDSGEGSPSGIADLSALPESAAPYRSQVADFLAADSDERKQRAYAALRAGLTPRKEFVDAMNEAHGRAGPVGLAAALAITAAECDSNSPRIRLKYFNTVILNLSEDARRQAIGSDASPAAAQRGGNARQRAYDAKQNPAANNARIGSAIRDALGVRQGDVGDPGD